MIKLLSTNNKEQILNSQSRKLKSYEYKVSESRAWDE